MQLLIFKRSAFLLRNPAKITNFRKLLIEYQRQFEINSPGYVDTKKKKGENG